MSDTLAHKIKLLPLTSGVYLMKDVDGAVIYVGKANREMEKIVSQPERAIVMKKTSNLFQCMVFIMAVFFICPINVWSFCICDEAVTKQEDYSVIFIGTVKTIRLKEETFEQFSERTMKSERDVTSARADLRVEVREVLKGEIDPEVVVQAIYGPACFAVNFKPKIQYIFFGYKNDNGIIAADHCAGTGELIWFKGLDELRAKIKKQEMEKQ